MKNGKLLFGHTVDDSLKIFDRASDPLDKNEVIDEEFSTLEQLAETSKANLEADKEFFRNMK